MCTQSEKPRSVYELLRTRAHETPDAIAITAPGRTPLTYLRLLCQIENVVKTLNGMGLARHDRIAIVCPNGPEMAVAFLAVSAGAVSAPLNPAYPRTNLNFTSQTCTPGPSLSQQTSILRR